MIEATSAKPLFSIIIPSYNHEKFIAEAIKSVLAQSCTDLELILIDDGSSDSSLEIIRRFQDPRLQLVTQKNAGADKAINRGLQMARGEFLCILNSDDRFHPARLEKALQVFKAQPHTDLIASWIAIIDYQGQVRGQKKGWHSHLPWPVPRPEASFQSTQSFLLNLFLSNFVSTTSNIVMRRKVFEKIGGMRSLRFVHDWDFLLRAAKHFHCHLMEDFLLDYRIHGNNTISKNRPEMLFEILWIWAEYLPLAHRELFDAKNPAKSLVGLEMLGASINTQGHDKELFLLMNYLDSLKSQGVTDSVEYLAQNSALRVFFISQIASTEKSSRSLKDLLKKLLKKN